MVILALTDYVYGHLLMAVQYNAKPDNPLPHPLFYHCTIRTQIQRCLRVAQSALNSNNLMVITIFNIEYGEQKRYSGRSIIIGP